LSCVKRLLMVLVLIFVSENLNSYAFLFRNEFHDDNDDKLTLHPTLKYSLFALLNLCLSFLIIFYKFNVSKYEFKILSLTQMDSIIVYLYIFLLNSETSIKRILL